MPRLTVASIYDDNVFRTKRDKTDDVYFAVTPRVDVRSNWARHAVGATATATVRRYTSESNENSERYRANLNGIYDVSPDTTLGAGAGFTRDAEDRLEEREVEGEEHVLDDDDAEDHPGLGVGESTEFDEEFRLTTG
jgi:hypothetical protein